MGRQVQAFCHRYHSCRSNRANARDDLPAPSDMRPHHAVKTGAKTRLTELASIDRRPAVRLSEWLASRYSHLLTRAVYSG